MDDPRANEILDIVAKETAVDRARLVPEAELSDLIPSLDLVQAIFAIEERFKVDIPVNAERSGAEFQTVGDLVKHVLRTLDSTLDSTEANGSVPAGQLPGA